jgi:hypothetical protein
MATHRTVLSVEICKELLEFTAGEEDEKEPYTILSENRLIEVHEMKQMLVYMIKEI